MSLQAPILVFTFGALLGVAVYPAMAAAQWCASRAVRRGMWLHLIVTMSPWFLAMAAWLELLDAVLLPLIPYATRRKEGLAHSVYLCAEDRQVHRDVFMRDVRGELPAFSHVGLVEAPRRDEHCLPDLVDAVVELTSRAPVASWTATTIAGAPADIELVSKSPKSWTAKAPRGLETRISVTANPAEELQKPAIVDFICVDGGTL
ncbi:hypothetical protein [Methylibium petroleiphilum]|uniref:Uncharacterized protein n=1 Tax=Methylibium petroleiphilum (strain ATCC BAA-1232 / LMG 22953 / PM1) TaxID=420662 RepID=A2SMM8_METPP|nr:hypothetical protein [Methylibium petroleiphilum]ABM96817.1 hypothetical protein Mpe_B0036 [Methylibium petroleiphilum PM1]